MLALGVVAMGLFFGLLLSWWGAARVTRPVRKLAEGAREVSEGNWNARVDVRGRNEIGQLATRFQSHDHAAERAARATGAGRARGRVARTGAAAGARAEKSALSAANHGRKSSAREGSKSRSVRRSFRESTGISALGNRKSEDHRRPLQRFRENAAAGARAR